jgi:hypothetical protein
VVDANLQVVAEAYDAVIDVTEALARRHSIPVPQLAAPAPVPLLEEVAK